MADPRLELLALDPATAARAAQLSGMAPTTPLALPDPVRVAQRAEMAKVAREPFHPPTISPALTAAHEAVQGASFGFGDELGAALEAAMTGKSYTQARDEIRATLGTSSKENPKAALAGGITGAVGTAFVPGLNVAKGAKLLTRMGSAAAQGAVAGLGNSKADLTKGEVLDAAKDMAASAVASGALAGAIGKIGEKLGGAPGRVATRLFQRTAKGMPGPGGQDRIIAAKDNVVSVMRRFGLDKIAQDKKAPLLDAVKAQTEVVGRHLGETLHELDQATGGAPHTLMVDALRGARDALPKNSNSKAAIKAIDREIKNVLTNDWSGSVNANGQHLIPFAEIHKYKSGLANKLWGSKGSVSEAESAKIGMLIENAINDALNDGVRLAASSRPALAEAAQNFVDANKTYSTLKLIEAATLPGARREALGKVAKVGIKKAIANAASGAADFADRGFAGLVNAARNGGTPIEMAELAVEFGFPREVGHRLARLATEGRLPTIGKGGEVTMPAEPAPTAAPATGGEVVPDSEVTPDPDVVPDSEVIPGEQGGPLPEDIKL